MLLGHSSHASSARAAMEKYALEIGVGVDRSVARSDYPTNDATAPRYGYVWIDRPLVFLIDSTGTVRDSQRGLNGLDKTMEPFLRKESFSNGA